MKDTRETISDKELCKNQEKLHTTELGLIRIKRNLSLETDDVVSWCRKLICSPSAQRIRQGKNWYISKDQYILTVNAHSYTIITGHLR